MKLEREFMIDSDVVEFTTKIGDIFVYSCVEDGSSIITYYFVKKDTVIQKLYIEADCGQNEGYISNIYFSDV